MTLFRVSCLCLVSPFRARGEKKMNALQCARYVYRTEGIRGFYRGLTASYAGISETMICFLIYETLKKHLAERRLTSPNSNTEKGASDFLSLMVAAAFSKGCASCIAYPHGKYLLSKLSFEKTIPGITWLLLIISNLFSFIFFYFVCPCRGHSDETAGGGQQVQVLLPDREVDSSGGRICSFL